MIFLFFGVGVSLCPLDREIIERIEMPIHEATSIQLRTVLCDYWMFKAQILIGIRSRIVFLYFRIGVSHRPLDHEPH